jgi:hypothetical protein
MRIASKARRRLPSHEKFGKLGVTFVKLNVISRDPFQKLDGFLIVLEFMPGETQ